MIRVRDVAVDERGTQRRPVALHVPRSLTTPTTTLSSTSESGERTLLKEQPVLGGFTKDNYVTERVWATARDGTKIPVSVLYRKGFKKDGTAALLQYGYGSSRQVRSDPAFNSIELRSR